MNRNCPSFISVAVTSTLTKRKWERKRSIWITAPDYNPLLEENQVGNSRSYASYPQSKQMDPCLLAAHTQLVLLFHGLGANLGNDSAQSGLGLHTSMSNKNNPTDMPTG